MKIIIIYLFPGVTGQCSHVSNTKFSAVHISFIDLRFYVSFINLNIYISLLISKFYIYNESSVLNSALVPLLFHTHSHTHVCECVCVVHNFKEGD